MALVDGRDRRAPGDRADHVAGMIGNHDVRGGLALVLALLRHRQRRLERGRQLLGRGVDADRVRRARVAVLVGRAHPGEQADRGRRGDHRRPQHEAELAERVAQQVADQRPGVGELAVERVQRAPRPGGRGLGARDLGLGRQQPVERHRPDPADQAPEHQAEGRRGEQAERVIEPREQWCRQIEDAHGSDVRSVRAARRLGMRPSAWVDAGCWVRLRPNRRRIGHRITKPSAAITATRRPQNAPSRLSPAPGPM